MYKKGHFAGHQMRQSLDKPVLCCACVIFAIGTLVWRFTLKLLSLSAIPHIVNNYARLRNCCWGGVEAGLATCFCAVPFHVCWLAGDAAP